MTSGAHSVPRGEWKDGWRLALSSMAGMALTPLVLYTLGLFIQPLEKEFGWSRAFVSSGLTVNAIVAVTLAPFVGMLVDRIGPRRVGIVGVISFCVAFGLLSLNSGSKVQWWFQWLLIALGALALKPTVWLSAVTSRFEKSRGLAIALTMMGASITAIVAPRIAEPIIDGSGWRAAYVTLAVIWGAIVLPLVLAFFFGSHDLARLRGDAADRHDLPHREGVSAKEALRSPTYLKLTLASALSYFAVTGLTVHLVPIVTANGLDRLQAATLASFIGIGALCGRFLAGYWLDRYNPILFGGVVFAMPAVAAAILLGGQHGFATSVAAAAILGIASGTEFEVASFLLSRFFGLRNFGLLMGNIVGLLALIAGISPLFFGYIFDRYAGYEAALTVALILSALASILIFLLSHGARTERAGDRRGSFPAPAGDART